MRYLLVLMGQEGCDYSIECGTQVKIIEASNMDEAEFKGIRFIIENHGDDEYDLGDEVDSLFIYEIGSSWEVDLEKYKKEREKKKEKKRLEESENEERREYERLKNKYESFYMEKDNE